MDGKEEERQMRQGVMDDQMKDCCLNVYNYSVLLYHSEFVSPTLLILLPCTAGGRNTHTHTYPELPLDPQLIYVVGYHSVYDCHWQIRGGVIY